MLAMIIVTTRFHDAVESVKVLAYGREGDQLPDQIRDASLNLFEPSS
jgi:hypothetical protein